MTSNKEEIKKKMGDILSFNSEEDKYEAYEEYLRIRILNEIQRMMKRRNYTKAKLAIDLAISPSFVTQLFSGNKSINLKMMARIEKILDFRFTIKADYIETSSLKEYKEIIPLRLIDFNSYESEAEPYTIDHTHSELFAIPA